MIFNCRYL